MVGRAARPSRVRLQEHLERLVHTGQLPFLLTSPTFSSGSRSSCRWRQSASCSCIGSIGTPPVRRLPAAPRPGGLWLALPIRRCSWSVGAAPPADGPWRRRRSSRPDPRRAAGLRAANPRRLNANGTRARCGRRVRESRSPGAAGTAARPTPVTPTETTDRDDDHGGDADDRDTPAAQPKVIRSTSSRPSRGGIQRPTIKKGDTVCSSSTNARARPSTSTATTSRRRSRARRCDSPSPRTSPVASRWSSTRSTPCSRS